MMKPTAAAVAGISYSYYIYFFDSLFIIIFSFFRHRDTDIVFIADDGSRRHFLVFILKKELKRKKRKEHDK